MSRRRSRSTTLTKAQNLPAVRPSATFTADQVLALATASASTGATRLLPRPPSWGSTPFGPGVPLAPTPVNVPRPESGRPEPRTYEYPQTFNMPGFGDRVVPWALLRAAADVPLVRRCIEIRKAEVATLDWDITVSAKAVERAQRTSPGASRTEVQDRLRARVEPQIGALVGFWECPDPQNGLDFIGWASKVLEEYFVLDAVAVYPRVRGNGGIYSLDVVDGTTIKPLLDVYGRRPLPPQPAFQQVLYGFPRGEFVADGQPDADRPLESQGFYPSDRLTYKVHNVRTDTPYGCSAVEQALADIELLVRRDQWMKAEYTAGVLPAGWLIAGEGQAEWTPQQLEQYDKALNDYFGGDTDARMRVRTLPYGMQPAPGQADVGERYKPDYDLYLIKRVSAHLDTTIAELGFTEQGGLGSTGWHEGQADVQDRKATQPTLRRLQALCTQLMRTYLGAPPELEFRILGLESEDEAAADEVATARVQSGRMTWNEDRDRTGLPRYTFPEADKPAIVTPHGLVFLEGASEVATPGQLVGPAQAFQVGAPPAGPGMAPAGAPGKGNDQPRQGGPDVAKVDAVPDPDAVKAELVAYRRWLGKGRTSRPFRFEHLTEVDAAAAGVDLAKAEFAEAGQLADPKSAALARLGTRPGSGGALGSAAAPGFDWGALRAEEARRRLPG